MRSPVVDLPTKTYSTWLEVEIGLDADAIARSWSARKKLFAERIEACLQALDQAAPGIRAKLEAHPVRPFAFTGSLTADDIRAIWHLSELRMLSDRSTADNPKPDVNGRLPFVVEVLQHHQAEASAIVEVERLTVIVRALDEDEAVRVALTECSTMPAHFMTGDFRVHRRWWTAERVYLNTLCDEERMRHGKAIVVDQSSQPKLKDQPKWWPNEHVERVAYGSPKQRPATWQWMLD